MLEWFSEYFLFLIKLLSVLIAFLFLIITVISLRKSSSSSNKKDETLSIDFINDRFDEYKSVFDKNILTKDDLKKKKKKLKEKSKKIRSENKKRIFLLNFQGDMQASQEAALSSEITAILLSAQEGDEVVICIESAGGVVHGYGLASSQLKRLRDANIRVTACVDKVAASGGYMMACVANTIVAAPFAIIGSVGVVAQLPNFHRFLKKHDIDFETFTAGEYKRTVTMFGNNTDEGREKFLESLGETHELFKQFVEQFRPEVNLSEVANGDYWYGENALKKRAY